MTFVWTLVSSSRRWRSGRVRGAIRNVRTRGSTRRMRTQASVMTENWPSPARVASKRDVFSVAEQRSRRPSQVTASNSSTLLACVP